MEEDREIKRLPNSEAGNIWAGWLIAKLSQSWPVPCGFYVHDLVEGTGVSVENKSDEFPGFRGLINWLEQEGYIRVHDIYPDGRAEIVRITQKSLDILRQTPASLRAGTLGDALKYAASDVGKDAAKSQLAELFGQFLGGIVKSVSS